MIDGTYAAYDGLGAGSAAGSYSFADILKVGSKSPKGDGKWGQADLSGTIYESILDGYQSPYATPCSNCANLTNMTSRSVRGGSWSGVASDQLSSFRLGGITTFRGSTIGARCARTP